MALPLCAMSAPSASQINRPRQESIQSMNDIELTAY